MIRKATAEDLPRIIEIGKEFHAQAGVPGRVVPSVWISKWSVLLNSGSGLIFVSEDNWKNIQGFIGGLVYPDLNDDALVLAEAFWYCSPTRRGDGVRLLVAFERWAQENNISRISMVHLRALTPERLATLYKRRGYTHTEDVYLKEIR